MSDHEIKVVISATDDYSAQLNRFNTAIGGMDTSVGRAEASTAALSGAFNGLRMAWMQVGAIIASAAWLIDAANEAYQAEISTNKLRIQIEGLGINYQRASVSLEKHINATARYAHVQGDEVTKTLQEMIFNSGKYNESLANLNLVYDLAYQKGISASEAGTIVGKAMSGNTDTLGRYIPELRNLEEVLGKNATSAEKSAYALAFLGEKTNGALSAMTEHEERVHRVTNAYKDLKQAIGWVVIGTADQLVKTIDEPGKTYRWLADGIDRTTAALNKNMSVTNAATNTYRAGNDAVMEMGTRGGKSAAQIAAEAKASNDKAEADKKAAEGTAAFKREMLRLAMEEEKIYEDMDARYAERLSKKLEADTKAAEAKRALEREGMFTALAQLAESDRESPYKPQAGEGGQLGDAYTQYQGGDQLTALQDYNTQRMQLMVDAGKSQYEIEAEYERLTTQMQDREYQMRLGAGAQFAGGMANLFQHLYTASGKKNKALFEMAKAFAIAEAVMNTAKAATQALAFPPGPPISFVYVAAAIAAGAAQIATIASSKPGGSGGAISAGGTAMPAYSGGSASSQPVPLRLEGEDVKSKQNITIIINSPLANENWDRITQDNIIPAINSAGDRNVKINIRAIEAY